MVGVWSRLMVLPRSRSAITRADSLPAGATTKGKSTLCSAANFSAKLRKLSGTISRWCSKTESRKALPTDLERVAHPIADGVPGGNQRRKARRLAGLLHLADFHVAEKIEAEAQVLAGKFSWQGW